MMQSSFYRTYWFIGSVVATVAIVLQFYGLIIPLITVLIYSTSFVVAVIIGIRSVLVNGEQHKSSLPKSNISIANTLFTQIVESNRYHRQFKKQKVVVSRAVDQALQEVFDLIMRDYIMSWYKNLAQDPMILADILQEDFWIVLESVKNSLSKVDEVKFVTSEVANKLCDHFQNVRLAKQNPDGKFYLLSYLKDDGSELEFLRKISEILIVSFFPKKYSRCLIVRHFLKELLACSIIKPGIELICDPDFINDKLIAYIEYREQLAEAHKRTYAMAASYEDFIKMINEAKDIEHLKQIRYKIMTEIMQATTINNIKKAKGIDSDKEFSPKGSAKGDLLQARNLRRYINQCRYAKAKCEKRIFSLGGPNYTNYDNDTSLSEHLKIPGRKVLSYQVIMEMPEARNHFLLYLQKDDYDAPLRFWNMVEELKHADKKYVHQIGTEIFQNFISSGQIKVDRSILKGMEAFMIGNKGPEAFYYAQKQVSQYLDEKHYPSFLVSDLYHRYISTIEDDDEIASLEHSPPDHEDEEEMSNSLHMESSSREESPQPNNGIEIAEHSTYAKLKLEKLDEKLLNKTQALQAVRMNQKFDHKIITMLEHEIGDMKLERSQLEFYLDRTNLWCDNIGKWKANIHTAELEKENDKDVPYFVIVVHLMKEIPSNQNKMDGGSRGWVVHRKLSDFHALHEKLVQVQPSLKKKELPTPSKIWFKSMDKAFLEKSKEILQDFLTIIMNDDNLNQSEVLYSFLNPSLKYLKQNIDSSKKTKFSFSKIFKGNSSGKDSDQSEDEDLLFMDEDNPLKDDRRDSTAEPLYALIGEIFELRGVFKWLRRTLMVFVQLSFGRTINRQLRDTVHWIFSESMLVYYINTFREALWPTFSDPQIQIKDDKEKTKTQCQAKQMFLRNIPEALTNLVGQENARQGAVKVFEVLQDVKLNKNLLYSLIEVLVLELHPELKQQLMPTEAQS